jgi:hypothetical protein
MSVKKIRVGVLSAGAWSVATHIPELLKHEDVELVIVTNQDAARAKQIGEIFGFEHVSNSWESALEAGLDAVIVSSPPIGHDSILGPMFSARNLSHSMVLQLRAWSRLQEIRKCDYWSVLGGLTLECFNEPRTSWLRISLVILSMFRLG